MTEPAPAGDGDPADADGDEAHDEGGRPSGSSGPDPMEQGFDLLRGAAQEVINVSRAVLDVAEHLLRDPETAATIAGVFQSLAHSVTHPPAPPGAGDGDRAAEPAAPESPSTEAATEPGGPGPSGAEDGA
jgi:hypothetical protein